MGAEMQEQTDLHIGMPTEGQMVSRGRHLEEAFLERVKACGGRASNTSVRHQQCTSIRWEGRDVTAKSCRD